MNTEDNELIQDFLRGDLSPKQRERVNDRLKTDSKFQAAFTLEQQQHDALGETNWSFISTENSEIISEYEALFKNQKTRQLKDSIAQVASNYQENNTINKGNKSNKRWMFYGAAAMLAVMFSVFSIFGNDKTNQELYAANFEINALPGLAVRGGTADSLVLQAEKFFNTRAYTEAIPLLDKSLHIAKKNKGTLYLYKAISHTELGEYNAAEETYNTLIKSDLLDAQKGFWYKALLYLKMDNRAMSIATLKTIVENDYFNAKKATSLLKELK